MQVFDYLFNVAGNFSAKITGMSEATGKFSAEVKRSQGLLDSFAGYAAKFDFITNGVDKLGQSFANLGRSGITLDSQMHDLSAVAGVTGDTLREIEGYARQSAKTFGTDAAVAVEGYKLLLSQLTPELAKCPEALSAMGESIQVTSKLMGGDGVAAAQVLTTAMNQYGVSMDDPIAASKTMANMMNVMAAAGQAGSAELPAISAALSQCGMAAKAANVSFEETNAAIQVLDKAGKKASEGGVALRNTLAILGKGRFLPKDTREELAAAGIDVEALANKNLSLKERLEMLKPLLNDSALLSQMFGMENANAARALIQGTDALQSFTDAVTGTNSAQEQAAIVMDSYAERQARVKQQIEDLKISLFEATGDAFLWASSLMDGVSVLAQMMPLLTVAGKLMLWIKNLQWASMWSHVTTVLHAVQLRLGAVTAAAVMNCQTMGVMPGLWATFKMVAVSACRAVSVAIHSIPIVGWIALAISAIGALGAYLWKTSATFRAVLKGLWAAFKTLFTSIARLGIRVFGSIGQLIRSCFKLDASGISSAIEQLKHGFSDFGAEIGSAFSEAYNAEMKASAKEAEAKKQNSEKPVYAQDLSPMADVSSPTAGSTSTSLSSSGTTGGKINHVSITIGRLVDKMEVHAANLDESAERIKEAVAQALMSALNDVSMAQG